MYLVYQTSSQVAIYAEPGKKSPHDFIVKYREVGKHLRTPKHIHLMVDLFAKRTGDQVLTNRLVDHIIDDIILKVSPVSVFPPVLQVFEPSSASSFSALNQYGEYSVEFLLVVAELIMIQEKTNYPDGTMNLNIFRKFRAGADIFSIASAASFNRR